MAYLIQRRKLTVHNFQIGLKVICGENFKPVPGGYKHVIRVDSEGKPYVKHGQAIIYLESILDANGEYRGVEICATSDL